MSAFVQVRRLLLSTLEGESLPYNTSVMGKQQTCHFEIAKTHRLPIFVRNPAD